MATKRDYIFTCPDAWGSWEEYFRAYAANREQVNAGDAGPVQGDVRFTSGIIPLKDPPTSAKRLAAFLADLGFDVDVLEQSQERFWRGEWVPQHIIHVTGLYSGSEGKSAIWARWLDGKAQECKVQVNGAMPVWVGVTEAKKMIVGAR